jgi:hypothetical protein
MRPDCGVRTTNNSSGTEVNRIRALRDKNPISMYDVRRVEQSAAGHIDYTQKYAIGCADLVHL